MSEPRALAMLWERADGVYFKGQPDRKYHIRKAYTDECKGEFWTLGPHEKDRRRILLCRVDNEGNYLPDHKVLKIPFLAYADETIEDTDVVLEPIIKQIMAEAFQKEKYK